MRHESTFFSEILDFYQAKAEEEFGLEVLKKGLSPHSCDEPLPLSEIIDNYQHLFGAAGPIHIEKILIEAFPIKDFIELGLTRYYPRMYRGLPRLYHRNHPAQSHIKKNFTHLPSLKRQAAAKALFSLYGKFAPKGKMVVFTWVLKDGRGDYIAASETVRLLKTRFPELDVHLITIESLSIPEETLSFLRSVDFVLQMPTFYPNTAELKAKKIEHVGEYGFLESSWFHPKSGNFSMGLHFLEKGILTRKIKSASWDEVKNEEVTRWRCPDNHFYLAYLTTTIGTGIYLHALLKSHEFDGKGIDLCMPDLRWLLQFIEKQNGGGRSILEWDMGIEGIEIHYDGRICFIPISLTGKKVRILCPQEVSPEDFQALLTLSGEFVGIRGDQSFTEVLSLGKGFFYDGRDHARYFMKDLLALAENRIRGHASTLACVRGMNQAFLYNLAAQDEEWVDETFFQEREDWPSIAMAIGLALQDPDAAVGFQKLGQVVRAEFSCNQFICNLVQRAFCHLAHPEMEKWEQETLSQFMGGELSFSSLVKKFPVVG